MTIHGAMKTRQVLGWSVKPHAWYPELPGKDASRTYPPDPLLGKRVCRGCKRVEVQGIRRYCPSCAKTRHRASIRASVRKLRSRVNKTGFSPIQAEALT